MGFWDRDLVRSRKV